MKELGKEKERRRKDKLENIFFSGAKVKESRLLIDGYNSFVNRWKSTAAKHKSPAGNYYSEPYSFAQVTVGTITWPSVKELEQSS